MKTKIIAAIAAAVLSVSAFGYDSEEREAVKEARVELHDCLEREGDESWEAHGECWEEFGKKMSQYGVGHWWRANWDGGGWVWIVVAAIFAAVAIVSMPFLIIVALVALWRRGRRISPGGAMEILADRFARGEIDADEYRARKNALKE